MSADSWKLSERDKRAIVDAYRAGEPLSAISDRYGVSYSYPRILARRRNLDPRGARTSSLGTVHRGEA